MFDAVVSSTVLYGCEAWTLKLDQQRRLKTVQRKMLRLELNAKRRQLPRSSSSSSTTSTSDVDSIESEIIVLEPWKDFLQRTAKWTDEQLEKANISDWLEQWKTRKWKWAGRLMTKDIHKWSADATMWNPSIHSSCARGRRQARPRRRWDQDFVDYWNAASLENRRSWHELARDAAIWNEHCEKFAKA